MLKVCITVGSVTRLITGLSTGIFLIEFYFQHFVGPDLHTNLDKVINQVLGDVKVQ
jgi:hypothetical protein